MRKNRPRCRCDNGGKSVSRLATQRRSRDRLVNINKPQSPGAFRGIGCRGLPRILTVGTVIDDGAITGSLDGGEIIQRHLGGNRDTIDERTNIQSHDNHHLLRGRA